MRAGKPGDSRVGYSRDVYPRRQPRQPTNTQLRASAKFPGQYERWNSYDGGKTWTMEPDLVPFTIRLSVKVNGVERDANEILGHLGDRHRDPMPAGGWPDLIPTCCQTCASIAEAVAECRTYYGVLFEEVLD